MNFTINLNVTIGVSAPLLALLQASTSGDAIARSIPVSDARAPAGNQGTATVASEPTAEAAATAAVNGDVTGDLDAAGWPWDESMHASTKTKTKEGLWRMKVGVSRPDPKPGFPKTDAAVAGNGATGTSTDGAASTAGATATTAAAGAADEDDEFAAFHAAANKSDANDAAAAASIPARKWTDADLGALCNQAATKLGDPAPIKEIIVSFVPEGQVPHSRNIPDDKREDFAKAVEAKAGITFAA